MLVIKNVHKAFKNNKVLDDVYFEVNDSSVFGLVGINGAGKSTLLRVIAGVYETDRGEVLFNDHNTFTYSDIRKDIIYVPDDPYYSFGANINSLKHYYKSFYNFDEERYNNYLNIFGLNSNLSFANFSKGMKRQASLLFGLAIQPKLLLLDEAFDGLDPLVRLKVRKALVNLVDNGCSIIISSHNLKELEDICDSYGILEDSHMCTYGDLINSKSNVNKYQLAFNDQKNRNDFNEFDVLSYNQDGRVINIVIRGELDTVQTKLKTMNPLLIDILPVNFEELFIYEVENRGRNDA